VDELSEDLCRFTEFVINNIAQWQEYGTAEQYQLSEELQGQLVTLYSKVLSYAAQFLKKAGPPLTKNMAWKHRVDGLFEDIRQLSAVLEWTAQTIQMKSDVFAAAGLPEERCRPRDVEELVMLVINTLVPEDSIRTSRAYISELYAQYLATLVGPSSSIPKSLHRLTVAAIRITASAVQGTGEEHQSDCRGTRHNRGHSKGTAESALSHQDRIRRRRRDPRWHSSEIRVLSRGYGGV